MRVRREPIDRCGLHGARRDAVHEYLFPSTSKASFTCENFLEFATVALSFLFDKYCLIME